jgi:hypothetical protein
MELVYRSGIVLTCVLGWSSLAAAEDDMRQRWPSPPADHSLPTGDVVVDHLSDLGNVLGRHMDKLSHDMIGLHVDGRGQRARLRLGGGNPHYLTFRVDSEWLFSDGKARVNCKLQLALAGHEIDFKLPAMDLTEDSYHGVQLVQVNVPLLERRF